MLNIGFTGFSRPLTPIEKYQTHRRIKLGLEFIKKISPGFNSYHLFNGSGSSPELAYQAFGEVFDSKISFRTCLVKPQYLPYVKPGYFHSLLVTERDSETLIEKIDVLLKVDGGEQAKYEANLARENNIVVWEF